MLKNNLKTELMKLEEEEEGEEYEPEHDML